MISASYFYLNDYLDNLRRLIGRNEVCYRPTHGPAITDSDPYVEEMVEKRE